MIASTYIICCPVDMAVPIFLMALASLHASMDRAREERIEELQNALLAVEDKLAQASYCAGRRHSPQLELRLDELYRRQLNGVLKIWADWGAPMPDRDFSPGRRRKDCAGRTVDSMLVESSVMLDKFFQELEVVNAPRKTGLWIGSLHLCHSTVTTAEILPLEGPFRQDAVFIQLTAAAAGTWRDLTERNVNARLNISLDGATIVNMPVYERNDTGKFGITGRSSTILVRAKMAALGAC